MKFKRNIAFLLGSMMLLSGCGNTTAIQEETSAIEVEAGYSLDFNSENYTVKSTEVNGETIYYRAFENIVYVSNPVDVEYQYLNFYVPEDYYAGGTINGYTIDTAPIFFSNGVGGYMPAKPSTIEEFTEGGLSIGGLSLEEVATESSETQEAPSSEMGEAPSSEEGEMGGRESNGTRGTGGGRNDSNTLSEALARGYVVASVGVRGRTNTDEDGNYTGKAPAVIVDLKAAVRYLRYNDDVMAGNANRIISNGTSAGGAVSVLLGATGNNYDYEQYLAELGAAPATDDIFAVSAFCPITNLENADMAYEWQFNSIGGYDATSLSNVNGEMVRETTHVDFSETEQQYSDELKTAFIEYLNNLQLVDSNGEALTLDENGEGSFKTYVANYVLKSAQTALDSGEDLSELTWLEIVNGEVVDIDLDAYFAYMGRSKSITAFDSLTLASGETSLFGTATQDTQHFTEFGFNHSEVNGTLADQQIVKMMNPLNYIGDSQTQNASYWRIRHGSVDSDTALAVPVILANILEQSGLDVDFEVAWGRGHSGDYDLDDLFDWIDSIAR